MIDRPKTIQDFIEDVKSTIQRWYETHTDRETWAEEWAMGDIRYAFQSCNGVLKNNFFTSNWGEKVARLVAEEELPNYEKCSNCGIILFYGETCDNCQEWDFENNDIEPWKTEECTIEELMEFFSEIDNDLSNVREDILYSALQECFDDYRDNVHQLLRGEIFDNVEESLKSFDNAEDNQELIAAALAGIHLLHYSGNILEDYFGANYIRVIAEEGLQAVFTSEEISEFLEEN